MIGPFLLVSALAAGAGHPAATGLEVIARTTDASGRTRVKSLFSIAGNLRVSHERFVYVPKSVCEGIVVSTTNRRSPVRLADFRRTRHLRGAGARAGARRRPVDDATHVERER